MSAGRKGRKSNEIPVEELQEIRQRERNYRHRRKIEDPERNAAQVKRRLSADLKRPLTKQTTMQIEADARRQAFIFQFYRYNGNIAAACSAVGVARATFNNWMKKFPEMVEQISEVNEAMLDLAEQQLLKNISDGKENSLFFFLCNKGKHRGWQDIRKLAGPKLQAIKIDIHYPGEAPRLPHVQTTERKLINGASVKVTEAEIKDVYNSNSTGGESQAV